MQMNDALEMQGSDCTGGGGHRREGEEPGPVTTDRESGTKRCDKKVGQRERETRDRGTEIQRDGQRKGRKTEIPKHRGRNEDRDREMRFGESEIEVGQRQCDRKR